MLIDRYIAREINYTLGAIFGVLMIIVVSHQFVRYLADVAAGEIPGEMLLMIIGIKAVSFAGFILPLALFMAVIIGLGRLYRDSEMVVIAACGIGSLRILLGVMRSALFVGIILGFISLYFNPWVADQKSRLLDRVQAKPELTGITSGRFHESNHGEIVYFVERFNSLGSLENIFIQYNRPEGNNGILAAASGHIQTNPVNNDRFLMLFNGHRYEDAAHDNEFRIMDYDLHGILIPVPAIKTSERKREAIPTLQLFNSVNLEDRAELQWRWSLPLAAILLAALGIPLSRSKPREGRYGKLFTGIMFYVIFSNLLGVARNLMERGIIPVELGLWWVHILLFILIIIMTIDVKQIRLFFIKQ